MPDIKEIEDVVQNINVELWEENGGEQALDDTSLPFNLDLNFSSNGMATMIEFCGIHIWDTENDDRDFDDAKNDYTPSLEVYIRRKVNRICEIFGKVHLLSGVDADIVE